MIISTGISYKKLSELTTISRPTLKKWDDEFHQECLDEKKRERFASVLFGNKRENHKTTSVETKRWTQNMTNPCKACAELFCMGICADRVCYNREYQKMQIGYGSR